MKKINRLIKLIVSLLLLTLLPVELVFYTTRWIITGKSFPDSAPLCFYVFVK